MQRQLLLVVPVGFCILFLERQLFNAWGPLAGCPRGVFRLLFYLAGFGPMLLALCSERLPETVSRPLNSYLYWHLTIIILLFLCHLLSSICLQIFYLLSRSAIPNTSWLAPALSVVSLTATIIILFYGSMHAAHPILHSYELGWSGTARSEDGAVLDEMRLIAISDLHWDSLVDTSVIERSVELINSRNPDLVVILGDTVTMEVQPFLDARGADLLGSIRSTHGIYVILGNHDFYNGRVHDLVEAYTQAGITVLRDEVVSIPGKCWLIGREDQGGMRSRPLSDRVSLADLLSQTDDSQPVILLDHQPRNLAANALLGIDLQLSGHTHAGQIWPITLLVGRIYDLNHGRMDIDTTTFIVTGGVGYWGPCLRLGSDCEVTEVLISYSDK